MPGVDKVRNKFRRTGIDVVGDVPWGTHFCQFYQTKKDLTDILVPYFKAGLESNEFCVWFTSEPLTVENVKESLRDGIEDSDSYIRKDQIVTMDANQWYVELGGFNPDKVLKVLYEAGEMIATKGFDGIRVAGNPPWADKTGWKKITDYEATVGKIIANHRLLAICSYPIDKCEASEIIDVVASHRFSLIRHGGVWRVVESPEHRQLEEALWQKESMLRRVVDSSPDIIFFVDLNGEIIGCNKSALELYSLSKEEELIGKSGFDLIAPEDRRSATERLKTLLKQGFVRSSEYRLLTKDGGKLPVEFSGSVVHGSDGKPVFFVGIARDITERKRLAELERRQTEIEKLAVVGRLAARVAHEINSPLGGIKNSFLLIKDGVPSNHPYYEYVGLIEREIDRISNIVRQIYDLYRPDQEAQHELSVEEVVQDVIALMKIDCQGRGVSIELDNIGAPIVVNMQDTLIRQVLYNL